MKVKHKSDSSEQRSAEPHVLAELNRKLDLSLRPESLTLRSGTEVELDGYDPDKRVLCEVYAHIGSLKGSQPDKVASDILKLLLVDNDMGGGWRKLYCFADRDAAQKLRGDSWLANAAKEFAVECEVVELPNAVRESIQLAQGRQTMVNKCR